LSGVLLCLPKFSDRDGQSGEVRGEGHGDQRGVTGLLSGHGHQPGGGAKLAPCAGGMRYPAIGGGAWRYLFCTETAIRRSRGSWDALVAAAGGLL
jgi:hypothetical protein